MRHIWTDRYKEVDFSLGLEPTGERWTYTYNAPGIVGGYHLGGATGRREVEGFICREILRLAEENVALRAVIERDGDIRRVTPVLDAALKERDRLAEELKAIEEVLPPLPEVDTGRPLSEKVAAAILYTEAGNEYGVPALQAEIERLRAEPDFVALVARAVRDERARIRRELLEALNEARQSFSNPPGHWTLSEPALRALLDRICPEEG